jgi:hypothetical protein
MSQKGASENTSSRSDSGENERFSAGDAYGGTYSTTLIGGGALTALRMWESAKGW